MSDHAADWTAGSYRGAAATTAPTRAGTEHHLIVTGRVPPPRNQLDVTTGWTGEMGAVADLDPRAGSWDARAAVRCWPGGGWVTGRRPFSDELAVSS